MTGPIGTRAISILVPRSNKEMLPPVRLATSSVPLSPRCAMTPADVASSTTRKNRADTRVLMILGSGGQRSVRASFLRDSSGAVKPLPGALPHFSGQANPNVVDRYADVGAIHGSAGDRRTTAPL